MTTSRLDAMTQSVSDARPSWLWQWVLLAGVISGILSMHVLTGGDMTGGHGSLPTAAHATMAQPTHTMGMPDSPGHSSAAGADSTLSASVGAEVAAISGWMSEHTGGMSHGGMAACILFLTMSGASLLLALRAGRAGRYGGWGAPSAHGPDSDGVMRHGPPGPRPPRIALCVNRI